MKRTLFTALLLVVVTVSALAGDPAAGKTKAQLCAACHGLDGVSRNDLWPNLKGQNKGYLMNVLKAYKGGTRKDPLMSPMAQPLSDEDIDNLSSYYSDL